MAAAHSSPEIADNPTAYRRLRSVLASRQWCHRLLAAARGVPNSAEDMRRSKVFNLFWYYSAELLPGVVKAGLYPDTLPMLPRMLLRKCDLTGADCLDIGSVEGLIPVLMCKQGAHNVVATDHSFADYQKLLMLKAIHHVNFDFKCIGTLYELSRKLSRRAVRGFDLINVSGVLYHVFSPLLVLAGIRPLLKKDGLMIVSTNIINRDDYSMEFNNSGKLQNEVCTFWYPSVAAFDYILRYFQLVPIDCLYYRHDPRLRIHSGEGLETGYVIEGLETGYLAVVCRAINDRGAQFEDPWLSRSIADSMEYRLCDQRLLEAQAHSSITYRGHKEAINLGTRFAELTPVDAAPTAQDGHLLSLNDNI